MSLITCKYNNIKNYLTPTKSWLEPLKVFVPTDISSRGLLIISEMIKKEKIMVKVTQPHRDFWESDKKPDYMKLYKTKDDSRGVVKFIRPKIKSRIIKKLGIK
jgi:hypothetical protein